MLIPSLIVSLIAYGFACLGMGSIALRILTYKSDLRFSSPGVEFSTRFLLGQGLLANLWVFIALPGQFSHMAVKGVIGLFLLAGIFLNYQLILKTMGQFNAILRESWKGTWGWKIFIVAALTLWLAWISSIGRPPTMDGTRFYLALPKTISASERLRPLPGYEEVASLGMQGEMQFAALMTLGSPESIQLFSWLTLTTGCILLLALGRQLGLNRHGQWVALAIVFSSSAVIELSGSGKTDMYGAAFAIAAFYWAFSIDKRSQIHASILTGLFSGMAVVAKISYAASFLPSLAIILVWKLLVSSSEKAFTARYLPLLLIGISAAFIAVQLPIKNQILFQNPLAPYGMGGVFEQNWYGPDTIRRIRLSLPLALTFGDYWAQIGGISPLFLMFLPLLFLLPKPRRLLQSPLTIAGFAALIGLSCWLLYRPATFAPRYFLGSLLLFTLPVSKAAEMFAAKNSLNTHIIHIAALLSMLSSGLQYSVHVFLPRQTYELLVHGQPDCNYDPVQCEILDRINKITHPGERVFTSDSFRYWLRPDLIQCALTGEEMKNYFTIDTPELRWRFIIGRGFESALFYNRDLPISNRISNDLQGIPAWLEVTEVETLSSLTFVRLKQKDNPRPVLYECRQAFPPAWDVIEISNP